MARSTANLEPAAFLADRGPSPSSDAMRREYAVVLADHVVCLETRVQVMLRHWLDAIQEALDSLL